MKKESYTTAGDGIKTIFDGIKEYIKKIKIKIKKHSKFDFPLISHHFSISLKLFFYIAEQHFAIVKIQ